MGSYSIGLDGIIAAQKAINVFSASDLQPCSRFPKLKAINDR